MTRIHDPEIDSQLQEFFADPKLPLYVTKYDDGENQEWDVGYDETPTWSPCIAAFTTWREAYEFAYTQAWAAHTLMGVTPRRWNYCYRPDGTWGGFGYWEPLAADTATGYAGTTN